MIFFHRFLAKITYMIVLSHISALEFWRFAADGKSQYPEVKYAYSLITAPPSETTGTALFTRPLHILVADDSQRKRTNDLVSHTWIHPLKKGDVFDAGNGLYVISPELCFLSLAKTISLFSLIEIGYEMCGTYRRLKETHYNCQPLTTLKKLKECVEKASRFRGCKKALRALRYVLDNSASPMETNLTMLLCLPYQLGGYGIKQPILNPPIEAAYDRHLKCDLYWHDIKFAIEYESNEFHCGSEKITEDSIRRTNLNTLLVDVLTVTYVQVKNRGEFEKIANILARKTSKKLRFNKSDFYRINSELRRVLFSQNREIHP